MEVDSVIGYAGNRARILSLRGEGRVPVLPAPGRVPGAPPWWGACTCWRRFAWRPRKLFRAAFGVMVVDRGVRSSPTGRELSAAALLREQTGAMFTTAIPYGLGQRAIAGATMQSSGASCRRAAATSDETGGQDLSLAANHISSNRGASLGGKRPASTWQPPAAGRTPRCSGNHEDTHRGGDPQARSTRPCRRAVILR